MHHAALILTSFLLGPVEPEVTFLEVIAGKLCVILDTAHPSDEYVLLLGSLASWNQVSTIQLHSAPTTEEPRLPREPADPASGSLRAGLRARKRALDESRERAGTPDEFVPLPQPPRKKTFNLFIGERDLANRARYLAVDALLHSFNKTCQVYVDGDAPRSAGEAATVAEVLRCFEQDVLPWASKHLGKADDVDRDGRFTIFLTAHLSRMQKGKEALDGFVRGSDFFLDLAPPFSNRCDMMVLNSALTPGPHLRTIVAHEYTHAVSFCGHALRGYPTGPLHQDEETWLGESLAHLVEDVRGFSRSNLDHRVRAYLDAPHQYPLVIPDTFAAGMWRSGGVRGGGFLFLRHVYQSSGPDLLFRLAQSNLRGKENLEAATEKPFSELFRAFGVALARKHLRDRRAMSPPGAATPPGHSGAVANIDSDAWKDAPKGIGPALDDREMELRLPGSALCLIHLRGGAGPRTRLRLRACPDVPLQATLFRMPGNP